jgi:hypothetical protein
MSAGFAAADMSENKEKVSPDELLQLVQNMIRIYGLKDTIRLILIAKEKNDEEDGEAAARGRPV